MIFQRIDYPVRILGDENNGSLDIVPLSELSSAFEYLIFFVPIGLAALGVVFLLEKFANEDNVLVKIVDTIASMVAFAALFSSAIILSGFWYILLAIFLVVIIFAIIWMSIKEKIERIKIKREEEKKARLQKELVEKNKLS